MIKRIHLLSKVFIVFIPCFFLMACSADKREEEIYQSLKNNQSKFIFKLNGANFYQAESVFTGHLEIVERSFTINFFDQFEGNTMIHFSGIDWYKGRPIKIPIKLASSYSNVMFGRIKDKANKLGEGYLMSEGTITFKSLTKEKIIIKIEGKAKKYPKIDIDSPTYDVQGLVVCKQPKIDFLDIDEKKAFYSNY
ncbi:hypothetical protein VB264_18450 [Arcicella aquatica]|uniref:Lipid/polyisoprenoid-binding YceI-like domain-containing protein n=1 Tax=Arcicella aquatica TaxID=217141 RepID=A0ABU5QSJ6_9BACT|nr:hypothetical protein [Arcicella aquatica]MEA5259784.1 hypothetical protein [Arcicella aquatica]